VGHGRLTERLLAEGLLTPEILQNLKKEWQSSIQDEEKKIRKAEKNSQKLQSDDMPSSLAAEEFRKKEDIIRKSLRKLKKTTRPKRNPNL